ncbi:MAG: ribonuclease P protein component [Acidobacteria bacterium]|nr:ribonuclease P protein component [Acidobacteriota bacterium]
MTGDARFRPQDRLRKRSEYQVIYDKGQRIPSASFVVFVLRNGLGRPRLGITATRRVGGAVRRNRAKRLVREVFRRHKSELENVDIVLNVRTSLPGAGYTRLEAEFLARLRPFLLKIA